jgi:hypothetical protein
MKAMVEMYTLVLVKRQHKVSKEVFCSCQVEQEASKLLVSMEEAVVMCILMVVKVKDSIA